MWELFRVEMAVREVKRHCSLNKTQVCVSQMTDSPLLNWLLRFVAQFMNNMRIGKDGKTSEMRTGRRWRESMAQFGERIRFRKNGEDGVSSFASRTTQGTFVGHHDRTRAISKTTNSGIVRGKSMTKQTLSDAWE